MKLVDTGESQKKKSSILTTCKSIIIKQSFFCIDTQFAIFAEMFCSTGTHENGRKDATRSRDVWHHLSALQMTPEAAIWPVRVTQAILREMGKILLIETFKRFNTIKSLCPP